MLPARDLEEVYDNTTKLQEFYKHVNSLLNGKGGAVIIHLNNLNLLERFDQKVDKKLGGLISDGSMYHDVFKRSYFDDAHLVYEITPRPRKRPRSTLDFKTKTSVNKGKEAPTYEQMKVWLQVLCAPVNTEDTNKCEIKFTLDKEVFIEKDCRREPFQESMNMQAKSLLQVKKRKLDNYCWEHLKLNEYISAFTKVKSGGSVYFGVGEGKNITRAWVPVSPQWIKLDPQPMGAGNQPWKVWADQKVTTPTVYYVAKQENVKTKETSTGKFRTEALPLTRAERDQFRRGISKMVVDELKWFGAVEPQNPVEVIFHDVSEAPTDHCVIEVRVNYYHGLCFHDKEGPESYRVKGPGDPRTEPVFHRIPLDDWVKQFSEEAARKMKGRRVVLPASEAV